MVAASGLRCNAQIIISTSKISNKRTRGIFISYHMWYKNITIENTSVFNKIKMPIFNMLIQITKQMMRELTKGIKISSIPTYISNTVITKSVKHLQTAMTKEQTKEGNLL